MKASGFLTLFVSSVLLIYAAAGCKTALETESPQTYTVIGIIGDARYFKDQGDVSHTVKRGDRIPQSAVIQTASGLGNEVMLVPGEIVIPNIPINPRPYDGDDKVVLYENSILKIRKLTTRSVRGRIIKDTRLVILAGSALCVAGMAWPTDAGISMSSSPVPRLGSIKPRPDASYYEIRGSNIVVHAEHAAFFFGGAGTTRVFQGAVALEFPNTGVTKDLFSSQEYMDTGEISQVDDLDLRRHPYPLWGWLRPNVPPPEYRMPQPPF